MDFHGSLIYSSAVTRTSERRVTGVAGVLAQTGSLSAVVGVLPNFWPFLANWSTAVLAGYWIIPAALIGWYMQPKGAAAPSGM